MTRLSWFLIDSRLLKKVNDSRVSSYWQNGIKSHTILQWNPAILFQLSRCLFTSYMLETDSFSLFCLKKLEISQSGSPLRLPQICQGYCLSCPSYHKFVVHLCWSLRNLNTHQCPYECKINKLGINPTMCKETMTSPFNTTSFCPVHLTALPGT